jgi:hypothetical protein
LGQAQNRLPLCVRNAQGRCVVIAKATQRTLDGAKIEIGETDLSVLSSTVVVAQLVARGVSRLTAERFVEIERGDDMPGRARPHAVARR